MGLLPKMPVTAEPTKRIIVNFGGYSNNPQIDDGEMREMLNMSSDQYPYLTQRQARGLYSKKYDSVTNIMAWKEKLVIIANNGTELLYNDKHIAFLTMKGEKQIAGVNNKLCIWPDKVYYDITTGAMGNIEATFKATNELITFNNNSLNITSFENNKDFKVGDAVDINYTFNSKDVSITARIEAIAGTQITFPNNTFTDVTAGTPQERTLTLTISRTAPDFDYIMEANNRLWGCKGNTIRSCKLGDPTNWNYYQSTAADSYAVDVGTDGDFTGMANFPSHLVFFKEQCMHKLYGTNKPSSYQITTMACNGMEKGSSRSAIAVDGTLFYKSKIGIMAYTGDRPVYITSSFKYKYNDAVAGTDKLKYYISMRRRGTDLWELFVYDFSKKLWHKEDDVHASCFTALNGRLMYYDADTGNLLYAVTDGTDNIPEDDRMEWSAMFGDFDEMVENKKIYSRLQLRFQMDDDSDVSIYIKIDNQDWQMVSHVRNTRQRSMFLPISPGRCDKFAIKLTGHGKCTIKSLVRNVSEGSGI